MIRKGKNGRWLYRDGGRKVCKCTIHSLYSTELNYVLAKVRMDGELAIYINVIIGKLTKDGDLDVNEYGEAIKDCPEFKKFVEDNNLRILRDEAKNKPYR